MAGLVASSIKHADSSRTRLSEQGGSIKTAMAYPHLLVLIDAQLTRIRRVRLLLDDMSTPLASSIPAAPVQVTVLRPAGLPRKRDRQRPVIEREKTALTSHAPEKPVFAAGRPSRLPEEIAVGTTTPKPALSAEELARRWLRPAPALSHT